MNTLTDIFGNPNQLEMFPTKSFQGHFLQKTTTPKVSVIIPVYNSAKYIQTALESVFNQTYTNYEIIVIDDGSTDDTREQLKPYQDKIRYFYQENQGSAAARNLGIKLAKGELIAFLDADDYWLLPEKLEKQVSCFQENPSLGCINTGWRIVDDEGKHIQTVQPWHKAPQLDLETWLKKKCVRTSAMVFRREWLEKVGGFDEELRQSHDVDLILRLSLAGCETIWLKEETVCYRQHGENTTQNSVKQAKYIQAVLDKFFSRDDLPESISKQESQVRYHTLVWIAWYQYRAGNLDEMANFLQKSLDFSPYLRVENIAHWLTSFQRFSKERGEDFDVDFVTDSWQWQQLVASTLSLKNIINQNILINNQSLVQTKDIKISIFTEQGDRYFQQGNSEEAAACYKKAIEANPEDLINYHKALEVEPKNAELYFQLGNALLKTKSPHRAIIFYKIARQLNPYNHLIQTQLEKLSPRESLTVILYRNEIESIKPEEVKITFATILLNEEEYIYKNLEQHYPLCDEWILVEGTCLGYPTERVTKDGLSKDRTAEIIKNFPDPENKIRFIQHGWTKATGEDAKSELRNRYAELADTGILVVIDADEFYRRSHLKKVLDKLAKEKWNCWRLPQMHLWKSTSRVIKGGYWDVGHNRIYSWHKNLRYVSNHNHPETECGKLWHECGDYEKAPRKFVKKDGGYTHPDFCCFHFGFAKSEENMRDKTNYYIGRGEDTTRPQTTACRTGWFEDKIPEGCELLNWKGRLPEVFEEVWSHYYV